MNDDVGRILLHLFPDVFQSQIPEFKIRIVLGETLHNLIVVMIVERIGDIDSARAVSGMEEAREMADRLILAPQHLCGEIGNRTVRNDDAGHRLTCGVDVLQTGIDEDHAVEIGFMDFAIDAFRRGCGVHEQTDVESAFGQFGCHGGDCAPEVRAVVERIAFIKFDADQRIAGFGLEDEVAERICHGCRSLAADKVSLFDELFKCKLNGASRDSEPLGEFAGGGNLYGFAGIVINEVHHKVANPHLLCHCSVCAVLCH